MPLKQQLQITRYEPRINDISLINDQSFCISLYQLIIVKISNFVFYIEFVCKIQITLNPYKNEGLDITSINFVKVGMEIGGSPDKP